MQAQTSEPLKASGAGMELYRRIRTVGLDAQNVYKVRDATIDREDVHISLDDGIITFLEPVNGHITGAMFKGQGEILLIPPNQVERHSLALFTKAAVLSEVFTVAYFRFSDDKMIDSLRAALRPIDAADATQFLHEYAPVAKALAEADALRTLIALTHAPSASEAGTSRAHPSIFFRAHVSGQRLGNFDVAVDDITSEQIAVGTTSYSEKGRFYDLWTTFPMRSAREGGRATSADSSMTGNSSRRSMIVTDYHIRTQLQPPSELSAETLLTLQVNDPGDRTLLFELSRYLKISSVTLEEGGTSVPVEFIQNEAIEGSQLARRGNDLLAVILPRPLKVETVKLKFSYAGAAMQDAGGGLLYVGARGAWFPNLGPAMSNFDLEFRSPPQWKLLATGTLISKTTGPDGQEVSHWRSEHPIPLAGFNLGRYTSATVTSKNESGDVAVEAYATRRMENTFVAQPGLPSTLIVPPSRRRQLSQNILDLPAAAAPDPARNALSVATECARTIDFLSPRLGKFPYASLSLTQRPGPDSQGWPGLVFLSSYAFLTPPQRAAERRHAPDPVSEILYNGLMASHETAHQWWGDAVFWQDYRSEWMMEALANYSALMKLESEHPEQFKLVMDSYRNNLERTASPSPAVKEAGPVSLGPRLNSSQFPTAYDDVVYGRGTWLIHMLREMFRDAATNGASTARTTPAKKGRGSAPAKDSAAPVAPGKLAGNDPDALFFSVLRGIQEKFRGRLISNADLKVAFEAALPPSLRFEGKKSLDWFFDGWVDGIAIPKYELDAVKIKANESGTVATAMLQQKDAPESLVTSVPIYASTGPGAPVFVERVFADGEETSIKLNAPRGTRSLLVDPYHTVLTAK